MSSPDPTAPSAPASAASETGSPTPAARTVQLAVSGEQARLVPDDLGGVVLEVGGAVQSHVDPADPTAIRYEYLRRMANVLDALAPDGAPLRVLHLGGGALTLPRYVAATRPGSAQTVVDLDRELMGLVLDELPLPDGADVEIVVDDARAAVDELLDPLDGDPQAGCWDAVVLDIDTDSGAVAHLAGAGFHAELLQLLAPGGALLVNVGDEDGLAYLGSQLRALAEAGAEAGVPGPWALADAGMLERRDLGNAVLAAGPGLGGGDGAALRERLVAAGPHPAAVLDEHGSAELAERLAE